MKVINPILHSLSGMIILLCSISVQSEELDNYCLDAQTNAQWESIVERAISNPDVVNLYHLRKDLCKQVEKGELTVKEATDIFEKERDRVVSTLQREKV